MDELSNNLRARVLEPLEMIADGDRQRKYQAGVPYVNVSAELFNQWDDFYHPSSERFRAGFDESELEALGRFHLILNEVSEQTPQQLPPLDEFISTDAWRRLAAAAASVALQHIRSST